MRSSMLLIAGQLKHEDMDNTESEWRLIVVYAPMCGLELKHFGLACMAGAMIGCDLSSTTCSGPRVKQFVVQMIMKIQQMPF